MFTNPANKKYANNSLTVSVVIPTLNEAQNLPHVLPRIPKWVDEVIIVDGRSTDNTVEVAKTLWPEVRIVMEKKKGKGAALRAGFKAAKCDVIVMLDADGSMAPEEIPIFVSALAAGADFAKGSRFLNGAGTDDMEYHRMLGNLGLLASVRILFGGAYTDLCYGYAAFRRKLLPQLRLESDGFEIETEMNVRILRTDAKIVEVPSFEAERIFGVSNLNAVRDGLRILRTIIVEFFTFRVIQDTLSTQTMRIVSG